MNRLKTTIALTILLFSFASTSFAQIWIPIIIPSTPVANVVGLVYGANKGDFSSVKLSGSDYIPWKQDSLDVSIFQGVKPNSSKFDYSLSYYATPVRAVEKINHVKYKYLKNTSYVSCKESWVNQMSMCPAMQKLVQTNFDIWELCSRKALIDFNSDPNVDLRDKYTTYKNEFVRISNTLEDSTCNGRDSLKLYELSGRIRHQLDTLRFNPETAVANLSDNNGWLFAFGVEAHVPFSDYVNSGIGFNFSLGFSHRKNLFGIGGDLELGGECQKDIWTSNGTIYRGEGLVAGCLNLFYGYRAMQNNKLILTPFVSVGGRFYDGGEREYNRRNGDNTLSKSGLSVGVGLMADIVLSRSVNIKVTDANAITRSTKAIRVKPYFSLTSFSDDMGTVPAINIAIEYVRHDIRLK